MHIALVANTAWSMFNFRQGVLENLLTKYKVTIIAPFDESVEKLKSMGCQYIDIDLQSKGTNPLQDVKLTINLFKIYKTIKPDLIIHYTIKPNIYGSIASKLANIKSIAVTTGLGYTFIQDNLVSKIAKALYKFSFKFPQQVLFLNPDDMQIFLDYKLINKNKASLMLSEGVNTSYFYPSNTNIYSNTADKQTKFYFLMIARMLKDKGVLQYIEAARYFKNIYKDNITFGMLGACDVDNPSAVTLEQMQKWHTESIIEYLGTTNDVRPDINKCDCIVLPSFYSEGVPRTLLEGASMKKPLITTDWVGCKEVVKNGYNGFLCKPKDSQSLIDVIQNFINLSQEQRQIMGENGREFIIKNFSESKIIEYYNNMIEFSIKTNY